MRSITSKVICSSCAIISSKQGSIQTSRRTSRVILPPRNSALSVLDRSSSYPTCLEQCRQESVLPVCAWRVQPRTRTRLHPGARTTGRLRLPERSEEHTSELQSLMRISYAVFCLKKKNHTHLKHHPHHNHPQTKE